MNLPTVKRDYLCCDLRSKITDKLQVYSLNISQIELVHKGFIYIMDEDFSRNFYEESLYRFWDCETESFLEVLETWEQLTEDMQVAGHIKSYT